jgi:hypothetical protein
MKHLIGVLSALLLLFASARSEAETVRCESTGGDYRSCSIDGRGGVRLTRQLSSQASPGSCGVSKPYWARCSDAHGNGLPGDVLQLKTLLIRQRTGKAFHQTRRRQCGLSKGRIVFAAKKTPIFF